jgi:hypothetical protein
MRVLYGGGRFLVHCEFSRKYQRSAPSNPLGGGGDNGSGSSILGLVLSLRLNGLGRLLNLGGLLGLGLVSLGLGGLLLDGLLLVLLSALLSRLGGLAADGVAELGERRLLLLTLSRGGRLVTLAESERQRRLALLLEVLLDLRGRRGGGSSLGGLSGDSSGVRDIDSERSGGLNRRDHGSSGLSLSLLGSLGLSGLELRGLLLLLGEDVTEEAVALGGGRLLLGALGGLVLSNSGDGLRSSLLSGLSRLLNGSGSNLLDRLDGLLDLWGLLNSRGLDSDLIGGLGLSLLLHFLLLRLLLLAEAEERGSLAASRSALGLLGLDILLALVLDLLLLGGLLSEGSSLLGSRDSSSSLSGSLLLGGLSSLLLLLDRSRLEALEGGLVGLRLGNGGGKLLGLSNLELQLSNPVVALSGAGSLESVLVALGGEVELVRAVDLGLSGISLRRVAVSLL